MKLSAWANEQGISYTTAYRWFKAGKIPNVKQMDNGTILVDAGFSNAEEKLRKIKAILENE